MVFVNRDDDWLIKQQEEFGKRNLAIIASEEFAEYFQTIFCEINKLVEQHQQWHLKKYIFSMNKQCRAVITAKVVTKY